MGNRLPVNDVRMNKKRDTCQIAYKNHQQTKGNYRLFCSCFCHSFFFDLMAQRYGYSERRTIPNYWDYCWCDNLLNGLKLLHRKKLLPAVVIANVVKQSRQNGW
ncbi:MAG: hypothetical protein LBC40_06675, partial [Dysgonamonadaceae bacterium]|jgi:hypothetical protein|nr:hypothetical protein [Dysgonamonadaceae bacterium]